MGKTYVIPALEDLVRLSYPEEKATDPEKLIYNDGSSGFSAAGSELPNQQLFDAAKFRQFVMRAACQENLDFLIDLHRYEDAWRRETGDDGPELLSCKWTRAKPKGWMNPNLARRHAGSAVMPRPTSLPDGEPAQHIWRHIIDDYIKTGAPEEVNLPGDVVRTLLAEDAKDRRHEPKVLLKAKKLVLSLLRQNVYWTFIREVEGEMEQQQEQEQLQLQMQASAAAAEAIPEGNAVRHMSSPHITMRGPAGVMFAGNSDGVLAPDEAGICALAPESSLASAASVASGRSGASQSRSNSASDGHSLSRGLGFLHQSRGSHDSGSGGTGFLRFHPGRKPSSISSPGGPVGAAVAASAEGQTKSLSESANGQKLEPVASVESSSSHTSSRRGKFRFGRFLGRK